MSSAYESILTPRQNEIIRLISDGKTTKQISGELSISVSMVKVHRADILKRMKVGNIVHAVARYNWRWIVPFIGLLWNWTVSILQLTDS